VIVGRWMSDNNGLDILVNGTGTGNTTQFESFRLGFANFTLDDHFVSGINTIDFVVFNGTDFVNPTGIRVEMTGTAMPIPEPGTWAMVAIGLGLIGLGTARRQSQRIGRRHHLSRCIRLTVVISRHPKDAPPSQAGRFSFAAAECIAASAVNVRLACPTAGVSE
jgi:hypothetical protein